MFDIAAEGYYCCDAQQKIISTASDPTNKWKQLFNILLQNSCGRSHVLVSVLKLVGKRGVAIGRVQVLHTITTQTCVLNRRNHSESLEAVCFSHNLCFAALLQGEVKLPVTLEDESSRELPSYVDLYRPIRQTIYSVLFNLNKLKIVHENTYKEKGENVQLSMRTFARRKVRVCNCKVLSMRTLTGRKVRVCDCKVCTATLF